jgi:putative transposase
MASLSTQRMPFKNDFSVIADSLSQDSGLPFASVLDAESIERVFREEEALFGQEDVFSTQLVLWAFLAQTLRDGKGVACSAAVADIATYLLQTGQRPGVGLPIARICAVISLATACVWDLAIGPYEGNKTGESALLRSLLDTLEEDDVILFDRYFCSFMMLALLSVGGRHVCTRLRPCRRSDFRRGRRRGPGDHLIPWTRPKKPTGMSQEQYDGIPETLTLREVKFHVTVPGRRTHTLTIVTTLTDPKAYSREDLAEWYGFRWKVELDIRQIKQTLHLDHVRCKTPAMVRRELWVTLLAYNLIRKVIATSAAGHRKQPRCLGFTLACQSLLASWMLLATGSCRDSGALRTMRLARIAAHEVANRPGRIEPRVLKRRRHRYPLMQRPRVQLRAELQKT